jgi:hypothetical protein
MGNGEGIAIGLISRLDFGTSFISGSCTSGFSTGFSDWFFNGGTLSE